MSRALVTVVALLALAPRPAGGDEIVAVRHEPRGPSPVEGPPGALVTIEFFCAPGDGTRSARAYRLLRRLQERHPDSIRIVYRLIGRSGHSDLHAEAAHEAFAQGRFSAFMREAYRDGRSPRRHELEAIADRAGVDHERLEAALADGRHTAAARRDHYHRRRWRVKRVPGLLVNGAPFGSAIHSMDDLESAYAGARDRAEALLARGVRRSELHDRLLVEIDAAEPVPPIGAGLVDGMAAGERHESQGPPPLVGGAIDVSGPHTRGPENAAVVVALYCSFRSRYCAQMVQHTEDLRLAFPREVRFVFKHLLPEREDDGARRLHEASLCAADQGAFWSFYDAVYRRFRSRERSRNDLVARAESLGLDTGAFSACVQDGRMAAELDRRLAAAREAGIDQTPSVVIGGQLFTGTKTFSELRALVVRELAPGILERASRVPPMR